MIRVNLQPKISVEAKTGFQMPVWVPVLLGVILILGCGGTFWYMSMKISSLNSQITSYDFKLKDFSTVIAKYEEAVNDRDYLKSKRDFVADISTNQYKWTEFFDMFKSNMPKDIWVNTMKVDRNGSFEIDGETFTYGAIGNFMVRLTAMPQLKGVTLAGATSKSQGTKQAKETTDANNKLFKITATIAINPEAAESTPRIPSRAGAANANNTNPTSAIKNKDQMPE